MSRFCAVCGRPGASDCLEPCPDAMTKPCPAYGAGCGCNGVCKLACRDTDCDGTRVTTTESGDEYVVLCEHTRAKS